MAFFDWSPDLDTRIPVIDKQHRRIADYINRLSESLDKPDRLAVGEVLEALVDYTLTHFAFEEEVMEMVDHPTIASHRKTHQLFAGRMDEFQARFRAGEDVARELCGTLKTWLRNHIRHDDGDYAPAVRELLRQEKIRRPLDRLSSAEGFSEPG